MAIKHVTDPTESSVETSRLPEIPPLTPIPPVFYRDDEPPDPPDDDPHWREFPNFDNLKSYHLLIIGIVASVLLATFVHMIVILAVSP